MDNWWDIDFNKLDKALKKLEMAMKAFMDPEYRKRLVAVRSMQEQRAKARKEREKAIRRLDKWRQLESRASSQWKLAELMRMKIADYGKIGKTKMKCTYCGRVFNVDTRDLLLQASIYHVNPDIFAMCLQCRRKGIMNVVLKLIERAKNGTLLLSDGLIDYKDLIKH